MFVPHSLTISGRNAASFGVIDRIDRGAGTGQLQGRIRANRGILVAILRRPDA
jgi:hypothetical protein